MKKSLIMLLAVVAAGIVHAAQIDWSFTGSTAIQGCTLYVTLSQVDSVSDISDISGAAVATVNSLALNARGNATYAEGRATNLSGDNGASRTLYFYAVSGDSYYYAGSKTGTQYVAGEGTGAKASGSNTSIPAVGGTGWVAIPEPTTVALLALGLAALGLKRKVA